MKIFTLLKHLRKPVLFPLLVLCCLMMKSEVGWGQVFTENFESYTSSSLLSTTASATGWRTTDNANISSRRNHWFITYNQSCNNNGNASLSIGVLTDASSLSFNSCTYNRNKERDVTAYNSFSTSNYTNLQLSFTWKCVGESDLFDVYDYGQVGYSTDGTNWTYLPTPYYNRSSTATANVSLPASLNNLPIVYIGFRWENDDNSTDGIGFVVDNISVTGTQSISISTGIISGSPFCAGSSVTVPFTSTGTFNSGNIYTAQLSNASGSFSSPVNIGTLSSTAHSGNIFTTIPIGTASGTGYRIRVISNNPSFTGSNNGSNLAINALPAAPTGNTTQSFCASTNPTIADLSATGTGIKWYSTSSGGTALASTTTLVNGTHYYASQTVSGCESSSRLNVTAFLTNPAAPTGSTTQSFCASTNPTIADLSATGTGIKWYSTSSGGTALASTTALINGTHYYASQTVSGCESSSRFDVAVSLTSPAAPTGSTTQSFCASTNPTIADLSAAGTGIKWYSTSSGGTALSSSIILINGNHYYASQTISGCESASRLDVTVTVTDPAAPTGPSLQKFCLDDNATVAALYADGSGIKWYTSASGGTSLSSGTNLINGNHYYASQTISGCEGSDRLDVTVSINSPVLITTQPVSENTCATLPVLFSVAAMGDSLYYQWYKDGSPLSDDANISGSQTDQLTFEQAEDLNNGTYYVIVSGTAACGSVQSNTVALAVNEEITVNTQPLNQVVCSGGTAVFSVNASGTGITYQWRKGTVPLSNGGNISGADSPILTITNVTSADAATNYNVLIKSPGGACPQTKSQNVKLIVNPIPQVNAVADQIICNNTATVINLSGPVTGTDYNWENSNTAIGISSSGNGNISFTSANSTNTPITSTITVTPSYTNQGTTCTGEPITFTITVNPTATVNAVDNQIICSEASTTAINFSTTTTGVIQYNWTNSNSSIGLAASGSGNIPSFTAINSGNSPVTSTIDVTPVFVNGSVSCEGTPISFTITVNPSVSVNNVADQVVCNNSSTSAINFTSSASGGTVQYNWTNSNPSIGLAASGNGNIPSFTAKNTGTAPVTATITVTPVFINGSVSCPETSLNFTITVNPTATVNAVDNQIVCHGSNTDAVNFSSPVSGGTVTYSWTNDNTSIGLAAGGNGNILSFTATNTGTAPATATITVTPIFTNGSVSCNGTSRQFTIKVNPLANITPLSQYVCSEFPITPINISGLPSGTITSWTRTSPAGISSTTIPTSGSGPISGTFTNTNTTETDVTFTINATTGTCTNTTTVIVTVYAPLVAPVVAETQTVCTGSSPTPLIATEASGGDGDYTYHWQSSANGTSNWANISGANKLTYQPPNNSAYYRLQVTTECGEVVYSNVVQISYTFDLGVTFETTGMPSNALCASDEFEITSKSISLTGLISDTYVRYTWSQDNPVRITSPTVNPYGETIIDWIWIFPFTTYKGTGHFQVQNTTTSVVNISLYITPKIYKSDGSLKCNLSATPVPVTINPTPVVNNITDIIACKGSTITIPAFTSPNTGGTMSYSWANNNTAIGLGSSGTGNISFTATNSGTSPITATITVTPQFTNDGTTCAGTPKTFKITVNPEATVDNISNQTVCNGSSTSAVSFTTTGVSGGNILYTWTNDNTSIGLAANGTGNISSFTASNGGSSPVTATITVTPHFTNTNGGSSCAGTSKTFTITVNPTATVNAIADKVFCNGSSTGAVAFSSSATGGTVTYNWTNNNTAIGLGSNENNVTVLPSFTATNNGTAPIIATITVTPVFTNSSVSCTGTSKTFTITVNPTAIVNAITDKVFCNGSSTGAIAFSSSVTGGTVTYNWINSNTAIGLGSSGNSVTALPSFTATNNGTAPIIATITVIPVFTNGSVSCTGASKTFTITINPAATVNTIADQEFCNGNNTAAIPFGTSATGGTITYNWTNNNTATGLAASGNNVSSLPAFTATNTTTADIFSTITITPNFTTGGVTCTGISKTFKITVHPTPNAGTISGSPTICVGANIPFSSSGMPGGNWISSNPARATVSSLGVVKGISSGNVTITYTISNACGTSSTNYDVSVFDPASLTDPGTISGPVNVCSSTTGLIYSVSAQPNATYYIWTVPSGWTITSGSSTNSITVTSGTTGGTISVQAGNPCGFSTVSSINTYLGTSGQWMGIVSQDWNEPNNWGCGGVPTLSTDVTIPSGTPNDPIIYPGTTAQVKSLTINGASLAMNGTGNLNINTGGTFTNNAGTFVQSGTGVVTFIGTGKINGTVATTFNNITMNGQLTLSTAPSITGIFEVNSGNVITNNPIYTNTSTLKYNVSGAYTTSREWFSGGSTTTNAGDGVPQNVIIQSGNITINTTGATNRCIAGNLQINSTASLNLNTSKIYILGNWTNNGLFIHNNREVTFDGFANQTLTGNTTFYDITLKQTGGADLIITAPITRIDRNLTVTSGTMKPDVNTTIEFMGTGNLDGVNNKAFYDLQIDNTSQMTIVGGAVTIDHNFVNNGTYTYSGSSKQTTFSGSGGVIQSFSGIVGSSTIFGTLVVGDNHPFSTGITLNASNDYTIQGGSISLSHSSTLNNTGNTVSFSGSAATISTTGDGIAYFHDAVTNVSLNPGSGISTFNNYLQINPGGAIAVNSPNYGGAATLIYNTATPSLTTGLEWNANSATPGLGQPFNVTIQNTNNIVMDGDRTVPGTLNIGSVNTLSLNDKMLTVNTAITGAGSLTGSQLSGLTLGGSAPALNFTQGGSANYLKTFTLNPGSSATLANALNIAAGVSYTNTGVLKADGPLNANGLLTLKSDANGDARIDISSAVITGEVTVERYIPARRAWRFLSVPFANTNQTINQAWQEGQTITSVTCPPSDPTPAGLGTQLAYINGYPGYDYHSTSNPSLQYWNNTAWAAPPSTIGSNKLTDHHSWYVFVRGDRHICLDGINGDNITTLRSKGTLNQIGGINQRLQLSPAGMAANNFFMVGNPYASPINLETIVNASRVNGFYADKVWVMDPKVSGNNGVGGYVTWTKNVGWVPNDPDRVTASYAQDDPAVIQSGQGFMVYSSGTNAQVQFLEQDKVTLEGNVYGIRARQPKYPVIFTNLTKTGGEEMIDGVAAAFDAGLSASVDEKDVQKLWNPGENIALIRDNQGLSVEKRPLAGKQDTLFYRLYLRQQPYALSIFSGSFPQQDLPAYAWLIDKYLHKQILVNLKDTTVYNFTPNTDTNSYRNRFMLVFNVKAKPNADSFIYKVKARIYPNPVNGKTFNLELQNGQKGKYTINIFTSSGRLVATRTLNYEYRQDTYTIHVPATIVAGNYIVQVMDSADKAVSAISLIISK
ncbi:T9SS type A sorting domain-containing protein [Parafilimonas sp.]|uniref:Ig-like domain-containing protein n=1 Tax=Parafilimonas sp. TaxID=1969739 RepID=UPI003F7DF913